MADEEMTADDEVDGSALDDDDDDDEESSGHVRS